MARCGRRTGHPAQGERHAGEGDDVGQQRQLCGGGADAAQPPDPIPGGAGPVVHVLRRQQRQLHEADDQPRSRCMRNINGQWRPRQFSAPVAALGHEQNMIGFGSHKIIESIARQGEGCVGTERDLRVDHQGVRCSADICAGGCGCWVSGNVCTGA